MRILRIWATCCSINATCDRQNSRRKYQNWIQVLQKTQKTFDNNTLFIFGHSGNGAEVTGGKAELAAFEDYLKKLMDFTAEQIKAGKTKEEINKTKTYRASAGRDSGNERAFQCSL
jgi:hypothetical protein